MFVDTAWATCANLQAAQLAITFNSASFATRYGKEFTDRHFGLRTISGTGEREFDRLFANLDMDHRPTPPKSSQTNGMVECFKGRIEDFLAKPPFHFWQRAGSHAAVNSLALRRLASAIYFGKQEALADDEGMAQNQVCAVQKWLHFLTMWQDLNVFRKRR